MVLSDGERFVGSARRDRLGAKQSVTGLSHEDEAEMYHMEHNSLISMGLKSEPFSQDRPEESFSASKPGCHGNELFGGAAAIAGPKGTHSTASMEGCGTTDCDMSSQTSSTIQFGSSDNDMVVQQSFLGHAQCAESNHGEDRYHCKDDRTNHLENTVDALPVQMIKTPIIVGSSTVESEFDDDGAKGCAKMFVVRSNDTPNTGYRSSMLDDDNDGSSMTEVDMLGESRSEQSQGNDYLMYPILNPPRTNPESWYGPPFETMEVISLMRKTHKPPDRDTSGASGPSHEEQGPSMGETRIDTMIGSASGTLDDDSQDTPTNFPSFSGIRASDSALTVDRDDLGVPVESIARIPYVHGSYAPAAPLMLRNMQWMRILRSLMPEAHADVVELLRREHELAKRRKSSDLIQTAKIMKWAENNPVVAAFGISNSDSGVESANNDERTLVPALEWDVFLDPNFASKVEVAMQKAENAAASSESDSEEIVASEIEVDRLVGILITRMILAHGSASQLAAEALGVGSRYTFSNLVRGCESKRMERRQHAANSWGKRSLRLNRRSDTSYEQVGETIEGPDMPGKASAGAAGIFVDSWLSLFVKALRLGQSEQLQAFSSFTGDDDDSAAGFEHERISQPLLCGVSLCLGYRDSSDSKANIQSSMAKSAKQIENLLGAPLRVVLDLKSRRVPPRVWARLVDNIRSRGILVEGLGSFDIGELRSIGSLCSSKVNEIRFFHSAGDMQKACHANEVNVGDTVYFNAGSLFWSEPSEVSNMACCGPVQSERTLSYGDIELDDEKPFHPYAYPSYTVPSAMQQPSMYMSTIEDYKKMFQLNIGCYIQEFSISPRNLDSMVCFLNKHRSIYNLGLAWGGINGVSAMGLEGDGYWKQRMFGRNWDPSAMPTSRMTLLHLEDHAIVQKAMRAGAWGQIGTVNDVGNKSPDRVPLPLSRCGTEDLGM